MNPNRTRLVLRSAGDIEHRKVIFDYGATWKYKVGAYDHDPGFEDPGYSEASFSTGTAPFGYVSPGDQLLGPNAPPCVQNRDLVAAGTFWEHVTEITLRKTVTIPANATRLYFEFGIDNNAIVYVDGVEVWTEENAGCQTRGSSSFWMDAPPTGTVVIAVRGTDIFSPPIELNETFFDMRLEAVLSSAAGADDEVFVPAEGRAPSGVVAYIEDFHAGGVSEYHNAGGELFFTLPNSHRAVTAIVPWRTHWELEVYRGQGWTAIQYGWIVDFDITDEETIFYGEDYLATLDRLIDERFNPDQAPDTVAELYPADATGTGGAKYVENTITEIVTDQLDRAIAGTNSPLGFITRGAIATMDETVTIYCALQQRGPFIAGLLDSHRAGTGKRTRLRVRRDLTWIDEFTYTTAYSFVVEDNPGTTRDNVVFEYGGLVNGFRTIPYGDFATRALGIGKVPTSLRLEYDIRNTPVPAGEDSGFNERNYGRLPKVNFWPDISDINDLRRRNSQFAMETGAVGKQVGLGLRVNMLDVKDGWDLCDSFPVIIQRGGLDTLTWPTNYLTCWGWVALFKDDGRIEPTLTLLPRDEISAADTSISDSVTVPRVGPVQVHDTDPPTDTQADSPDQVWINTSTGHVWLVDPETGLWYDATDAGDFTALGALTIKDEGVALATGATALDFVGAGVDATGTGAEKTITIPGTPTGPAGGDLSGTYPNPTVVDDGHEHTGLTVPTMGPLLLDSTHSTPIIFDDILQASDFDDFLYASEP